MGYKSPGFKSSFEHAINSEISGLDVVVFNTQEELTKEDYYFLDDHLNPAGHRKLASLINDAVAGAFVGNR